MSAISAWGLSAPGSIHTLVAAGEGGEAGPRAAWLSRLPALIPRRQQQARGPKKQTASGGEPSGAASHDSGPTLHRYPLASLK